MAVMYILVLLLCLVQGYHCQQWSSGPQDDAVVYACASGTLSLPWTLNLPQGATIVDIQWFYSGRSQEMIATFAHGNFLTMPAFSGRVQQATNAGLDIEDVQAMDRGNYSVEVIVREAGGNVVTLQRSAFVHVTDDLQTSDGQLHVAQQPVAEYNNTTIQYHVVLRCGNFTYPTHPPFEVTWLTYTGLTVSSSSYQDGSFHLMLSNPVEGGSYTCRFPPTSACLHGNTEEATLVVDKTEARLTVLESKNNALENRNSAWKLEPVRKTSQFPRPDDQHHTPALPTPGSTIIMSTVINNQGNAYDSTSGVFTAPFNGSYCFVASTETGSANDYANMYLMVDDKDVDYVYNYLGNDDEAGSVQAVVQLVAGQRVWLKSQQDSWYWSPPSAFSGFLISPDP